jgi:lipoprotein NlpD
MVASAADGEVVYSGNGLVGYGELIIVKHSMEFLSAYGGSGKRLVAEGTKVKAGTSLAEIGAAGIVHFEIRRAGKPVDPLDFLPSR